MKTVGFKFGKRKKRYASLFQTFKTYCRYLLYSFLPLFPFLFNPFFAHLFADPNPKSIRKQRFNRRQYTKRSGQWSYLFQVKKKPENREDGNKTVTVFPKSRIFDFLSIKQQKSLEISPSSGRPCNVWFPPFRWRSSVAVSPFPLAVSVHRCRCRCRMPWLVDVDDWLASYGTEQRKNRTRSDFNGRTVTCSFLSFTTVTKRNFLT